MANKRVKDILAKINDKSVILFDKKRAVKSLSGYSIGSHILNFITTGNPEIGSVRGRIYEFKGPEGSGKTTLLLHALAEAQMAGGVGAFIDAEHAMDPAYASNPNIGVDLENLLFVQPNSGEHALTMLEKFVDNKVDIIGVDSVSALVPEAELDGNMGDSHMGLQARLMSQAMRKLTGKIAKSGSVVIFINQIRMKIGVVFGNPETTSGGNALKFYSSVRMDIRSDRGDKIVKSKDDTRAGLTEESGGMMKVKVIKNKIYLPHTTCTFKVDFGKGIDKIHDKLTFARACGIVDKLTVKQFIYKGKQLNISALKDEKLDEIYQEAKKTIA